MKDSNIINSKLYETVNYISYFLITNILFLFMISPLVIYWLVFGENSSNTILLLLSILLGPAITTLFSVMGRLLREKEISPVKDFFYFYKINLFQSIIISIILNMIISLICFDIKYFSSKGNNMMAYVFFGALLLVLMLTLYIYPVISRYSLKLKDLFKISLKLFITKPFLSLSSLSIIVIVLGFIRFARISLLGLLIGVSLIVYMISKIQMKTIDELEEHIKNLYKN